MNCNGWSWSFFWCQPRCNTSASYPVLGNMPMFCWHQWMVGVKWSFMISNSTPSVIYVMSSICICSFEMFPLASASFRCRCDLGTWFKVQTDLLQGWMVRQLHKHASCTQRFGVQFCFDTTIERLPVQIGLDIPGKLKSDWTCIWYTLDGGFLHATVLGGMKTLSSLHTSPSRRIFIPLGYMINNSEIMKHTGCEMIWGMNTMAVGGCFVSRWWVSNGTSRSMTTGQYMCTGFCVGAPKRPRSKSCCRSDSPWLSSSFTQICITGCTTSIDPRGCSIDGTDPRSHEIILSATLDATWKQKRCAILVPSLCVRNANAIKCQKQDAVVKARRLPSITYASESRPSGKAILLWCVPLLIQQ